MGYRSVVIGCALVLAELVVPFGGAPVAHALGPSVVQVNAPAPIYGGVQVHGSGFAPGQPVAFKPCNVTDPVSGLVCADAPPFGAGALADAAGEFDFAWAAPSGNCGSSACLWNFYQPETGVVLFNPVVYDPMDHSIAIVQPIPYAPGEVVTVEGTHWPSLQAVDLVQCSSGGCVNPSLVLGGSVSTTSIFGGTFSADAKLRRTVRGVDCFVARCWLSARMGVTTTRRADLDLVMAPLHSTAAVGYFNTADEDEVFGCAPVILTKSSRRPITVRYHSFDAGAAAGLDYQSVALGSVTIPTGQFLGCARVDLIDDDDPEGTELIGVRFDSVSTGAILLDGARDSYIFVHDND